MKKIKQQFDQILRCYKCGNCRAFCPIFSEIDDETAVARGLIALIEGAYDGLLPFTEDFQKYLYQCPNCRICVENCPSGVRFDKLLLAARAEILEKGNLNFLRKQINLFWEKGDENYKFFIENILLPQLSEDSLFYSLFNSGRTEKLPEKNFLKEAPEIVSSEGTNLRIGYFVGCVANYIFPEISRKIVEFLRKNGIEVVIPKGQKCCAHPMINLGDFEGAKKLAEQNIRAFSEYELDGILTGCKWSAITFREYYPMLFPENDNGFSVPIYNFQEFMEKFFPDQKSRENFEKLDCVSGEIIFNVLNVGLSQKLLDKSLSEIAQSRENTFITDDLLCFWRLQRELEEKGRKKILSVPFPK